VTGLVVHLFAFAHPMPRTRVQPSKCAIWQPLCRSGGYSTSSNGTIGSAPPHCCQPHGSGHRLSDCLAYCSQGQWSGVGCRSRVTSPVVFTKTAGNSSVADAASSDHCPSCEADKKHELTAPGVSSRACLSLRCCGDSRTRHQSGTSSASYTAPASARASVGLPIVARAFKSLHLLYSLLLKLSHLPC